MFRKVQLHLAFIESMSLKYNDIARDSGSIIISACGFDSIPSELGMVFLQKWFDDDKCQLDGVEAFLTFPTMHPGYSGHATTWDCAVMGFANQAELGAIRKQLSLAKIPGRLARRSNLGLITNVTGITGRAIPFVGSDASIVRRSQHRLMIEGRRDLQAARFNMYTVVETTTGLVKLLIGGFIFVCLTKFEIGQNLLSRFASFFSFGMFTREGPSPASIAETSFAITFKAHGQSAAGDGITKTARVTGPEPGYDATSKIMASCANVVLGERSQITDYVGVNGGVFTTADALAKTSIYEKLAKRGIEYQKL